MLEMRKKDQEKRIVRWLPAMRYAFHSCYSSDAWTTAWIERFVGSNMTVTQRLHLCLKLRNRLTESQ